MACHDNTREIKSIPPRSPKSNSSKWQETQAQTQLWAGIPCDAVLPTCSGERAQKTSGHWGPLSSTLVSSVIRRPRVGHSSNYKICRLVIFGIHAHHVLNYIIANADCTTDLISLLRKLESRKRYLERAPNINKAYGTCWLLKGPLGQCSLVLIGHLAPSWTYCYYSFLEVAIPPLESTFAANSSEGRRSPM